VESLAGEGAEQQTLFDEEEKRKALGAGS